MDLFETKGRTSFWLLICLVAGPACAQTGQAANPQAVTWGRFFRNVCEDQKGIWSSPFRLNRQDAKWWVLFGSATGALVASDKWTSKQLPNTQGQIRAGLIASRFGAAYSLAPGVMAFYFTGAIRKDDRLRETGLLGMEALTNAIVVSNAIKVVTQRERPLEGDGSGRFWKGSGRIWNTGSSFPSSHATQVWAVASLVAHEYPRPRVIPVLAYSLATTVMASRFAARRHFASDAVAGAAIGWFLGDYIYRKRHVRTHDSPRSKFRAVLSWVGLGQ